VREGIVTYIVQQCGHANSQTVLFGSGAYLAEIAEGRQRPPGEVVRSEGMLESGMGGAGVDEKGVSQLTDVAQALNRRSIESEERGRIDPDVVPQRVSNDFSGGR
jgi:hypothetical protein